MMVISPTNFFASLISFSFFIGASSLSAQNYFVAVGGSNSLSTSINTPGDIVFAFANAPSHSTVYVKAGNYGAVNLVVGSDSTTFIGYTNVPLDLNASSIPDSLSTYLSNSYVNVYPTIDKNDKVNGGVGITIFQRNVKIKNFYIRNYLVGISEAYNEAWLENIILDGFGDASNSYSGVGLSCYGDRCTVKNCFILNAGAEAYTLKGSYNTIESSKCYSNDTTAYAPTDYYFIITFNSNTAKGNYNIMKDCYAERVGNLSHPGHGFCNVGFYVHQSCSTGVFCYDPSFRYDSVCYNKTINCVTKNIAETVLLRGANTCYNEFIGCRSISYGSISPIWGCKYNTFTNCVINNSDIGIRYVAQTFGDTTDINVPYSAQSSYPWEQNVCAEGNKFFNCLFNNVTTAIFHDSYSEHINPITSAFVDRVNRKIIKNNDYVNCTFIARADTAYDTYVFYAMRGNSGNRFLNCAIYDFDNFESRYFSYSTTSNTVSYHGIVPTNCTYDHCNFYNNGFNNQVIANGVLTPVPNGFIPGINNTLAGTFIDCNILDPGFVNPGAQNYHIQVITNSGTIDKGRSLADMTSMGFASFNIDLDSNLRPCNSIYDIGAYEYVCNVSVQNNSTSSDFRIFPNPSTEQCNIIVSEKGELKLFNSLGEEVGVWDIHVGKTEFNIAYLSNGIYFYKFSHMNGTLQGKLIRR